MIFEKLLQRQNLLKFGVVLPQYPTLFHHSPPNVRSYKAAAWLVNRVGGSLCVHISLSLISFLSFLFFSFPTFYMFVIAYLPRWLSLTTRVVKVNHKGD